MTSNKHNHICITCDIHHRFAMTMLLLVTSFWSENMTTTRCHSISNMLAPLLPLDYPSPAIKALIVEPEASRHLIQLFDILRGQIPISYVFSNSIHFPVIFRGLSLSFLHGCAVNKSFNSSRSLIITLRRSLAIQALQHEVQPRSCCARRICFRRARAHST